MMLHHRAMMVVTAAGLLGAAALAGCDSDDDPPSSASSGAGAASSSSSSASSSGQGGAGECLLSTDCPGQDNGCGLRTCINHICGLVVEPLGSSCNSAGGTVCDGDGACVECLDDNQCDLEDYCADDQTCHSKKGVVQPCTQNNECLSASCADGICCGSPCAGLCEACVFDKTGAANGSCEPVSESTDPDDECPDAQTCNGLGACSG